MEKNLDYLFNDVPLYVKEEFQLFELKDGKYDINKNEKEKFCKYIGINKDKIISYCHKCRKEFPFKVDKRFVESINYKTENLIVTKNFDGAPSGRIKCDDGTLYGAMPPYPKDFLLNNQIWYVEYSFRCTNDYDHMYLMMISIELKDGKFIVRKIGQNPSMLTIKGFDFDKYKKILEELNIYDDYKKADLSNADHFYVGAYAYLRRIFEKIIIYYLEDKTLKDDHMDTKIEAVKDKFDPRVRNLLKNLYGILSKGIHELDEEECKEYYQYLKTIIDMQLEYMNTEREKEKQTKELEGIINKITTLINNKK